METNQPPPGLPGYDTLRDAEHIKLLVIFHYVMAGLTALGACFPVLHLLMGAAMIDGRMFAGSAGSPGSSPEELRMMGWFFVGFSAVFILGGWAIAVLVFFAGRSLSHRKNRTFVFVMACIQCLIVPIGTALGIFTILVLERPSVKALFGMAPAAPRSMA